MICTKSQDSPKPKPLYGNSRLQKFFREPVLEYVHENGNKKTKIVKAPKTKKHGSDSRRKLRQLPLESKIFRDMDVYIDKTSEQFNN